MKQEEVVEQKDRKPRKPPKPQNEPPQMDQPQPDNSSPDGEGSGLDFAADVSGDVALDGGLALDAALKFKYKPRVVNGEPMEVAGVQNRITFKIDG